MKQTIYLLSILLFVNFPSMAGKVGPLKQVAKAANTTVLSPALERKVLAAKYAPNAYIPPYLIINSPMAQEKVLRKQGIIPASPAAEKIPTLGDKPVSLTDAKGNQKGQHSIMPSAVTVLGSPAIVRAEERSIMYLRDRARTMSAAEYIPPMERERWRAEFEALRVLYTKATPTSTTELHHHLTHQVPDETMAYLRREYAALYPLIERTNKELMPRIIYSYLQNEGKQFDLEEKIYINKSIHEVRSKVASLLKALKTDPYLRVQQKYWDRMFGAFNPLLKGILAAPGSIFRQDNRKFLFQEFALHNPDGSIPYLPESKTMIAGEEEEDDFDDEQYEGTAQSYKRRAAQMAAERKHKAEMIQLAEAERDALLANIPANMRIAVINDDRLPLVNFEYWAKNGYLGQNATVATFKNGFTFMQQIKKGVRYDVVITDLVLPDGGVAMMEDFRILDPNAIVFASSKFYPGDGDDHSAQDLFNFGMDGYIWNNTNLNEGSFGYLQYLRQLNNYFYYKQKNNWGR